MKPGREIDVRIAKEVFGYEVTGERPIPKYSSDISAAWEVAEKTKVTLLPIVGGQWFAFVGPVDKVGWESPQALLQFLESGNFNECGAAIGEEPALIICEAALNAIEKRVKSTAGILASENTTLLSDLISDEMH